MADLDSSQRAAPTVRRPSPPPSAAPVRPSKVSKFDRPSPPHDWRFWVGGLGKTLIAIGLLMFGFVGYQLWGTGIETARAQNALENEFTDLLASVPTTQDVTTSIPDTSVPDALLPDALLPDASVPDTLLPVPSTAPVVPVAEQNIPEFQEGDAIARLEIPAIGVDHIVVAGVQKSDLKKGPGHYPETPLPGQLGNAAIAGHRTTYGQPFYDIDQLEPGDEIITTTPSGRFVYVVTGQQVVSPSDYQVVATTDPTTATLTLTSCHPRWTARQRIVISSTLDQAKSDPVGESVLNYGRPLGEASGSDQPTATTPDGTAADGAIADGTVADGEIAGGAIADEPALDPLAEPPADAGTTSPFDDAAIDQGIADSFDDGWFEDPAANSQVAFWGVLLALIGLGSYLLSRKARRDWVGLVVGIVPFMVTLYFFFQNVNRLLPTNL